MFELIYLVVLMAVAFFYGSYIERSHLKDLRLREANLNHIPWKSSGKKETFSNVSDTNLLMGDVVIA